MGAFLRILTRNWKLKLSALALAIFLWTGVRVPAGPSRGVLRDVPVRVQLNDPDWVMNAEPVPSDVQVRVEGPNSDLVSLQLERPVIRVPIDRVASGDTVVQLRRDWLSLRDHPGVVVEDIQPSSVRLRLEPVESSAVPLALRLTGTLPDTLALSAPLALSPQVARISGPSSRLAELDSIPLQPFDLSEVQRSGMYTVPLDTAGLGDLSVSSSATSLTVRVEPRVERVVTGVPVAVEGAAAADTADGPAYEILPATFQVTLRGPRSRVLGVSADSLRILVPGEAVEGLGLGEERRVPIRLDGLPELVQAAGPSDSVSVRRPDES